MSNTTRWIADAIHTLGLTGGDIRLLEEKANAGLYDTLENHFVNSKNRRWWWEDFRHECHLLANAIESPDILKDIIPAGAAVWFMVEADNGQKWYPIYEVQPAVIPAILGECPFFEYYVIDKAQQWLLCENHHGALVATGPALDILTS